MKKTRVHLYSAVSVLCLLAGANAMAQTTSTADAPAADNQIQEVIVTAERRTSSVQKTAISIAAITSADIARKGISTVDGALRDVPNVVLQGNANGAYIYIRGVGSQQDSAIGGPGVNLNLDGIYQQQTDAPMSSMFDITRVEVLRGPQGTLYGRNATAGSVNLITANPTFNGFHGKETVSFGNYGAVRSETTLNVPLSDTVAVRFAGLINRHDGYLTNGNNDADDSGGRLKLLWKASDNTKILFATDYLHAGGQGLGAVDPLATHPDDAYYASAPTSYLNLTYHRYYAQIDSDLGWANLTVLPAYQTYHKLDDNVLINYPNAATTAATMDMEEKQKSLEVRLASPASSRLVWLLGAFYLDSDVDTPYSASHLTLPASAQSLPYLAGNHTTTEAIFGQITYPVTDAFRLTAGLRYTHDDKAVKRQLVAGGPIDEVSNAFDSTTYKVGAEYDLTRRILTYITLSTGFKAGGLDQAFIAYQPEKLKSTEAGIKSRFFQNRLQVNASAFNYDYENFQAQYGARCQNSTYCPTILAFANRIVNAGTAKVYGGEIETVAQPWSNGRLTASVSYTHSRFSNLVISAGTANNAPAGCAVTLTCTVLPDQILTDQPLANAPEWTEALGYEHNLPLSNGANIQLSSDIRWSEGYWTLYRRPPQVPTESYQKGYSKANASIAYVAPDEKWTIRAFVRNLTDVKVVTGAIGPALTLDAPRTYGIQLSAEF